MQKMFVYKKKNVVFLFVFTIALIFAQQQKPQYFNECGGSLELDADATYGILTNPDYPTEANRESRYPNNADCLWTLEGDEATLVQVKIWDLAIEPGENNSNITCDYDYLNITIDSIGTKKFCGAYPPMEIIRGMGTLTVLFISDDSVNYRGFQATFQKIPDYDPCRINNPCEVGTCEFDVESLKAVCACPPGLQGEMCDEDVQECESQPCLNGGECKDDGPINTYECVCQPGWKGVNCESEQGPLCSPNPCQFNGKCKEENRTSFSCTCEEGYLGELCETTTGCGNPGLPKVHKDRRFNFGTRLSYSCAGDFEMKGKANSTCQDDGSWSNSMPECEEKDQDKNQSLLNPWSTSMIVLGVLFATNLAAFVMYMAYQRPWNLSRPNLDRNFSPSINSHETPYSFRKSSIYSISASQLSDSVI